MLPMEEILNLSYTTESRHCGGCANNCMLTINHFPTGEKHITGNRCERGAGGSTKKSDVPNLMQYKLERMFRYPPLKDAPRGEIGIPRVLNMYENYPFWATFFTKLGFRVVLSPASSHRLYEKGMESIPSESEKAVTRPCAVAD